MSSKTKPRHRMRPLAFLTLDTKGSTPLIDGRDEKLVQDTFTKFDNFLKTIFHQCSSVAVDISGGDAATAAFENIDFAVKAGKEILTRLPGFNSHPNQNLLRVNIRIRCGANCGEVRCAVGQVEIRSIRSRVLSLAGKLQGNAEPDTLLITGESYDQLGDKEGFDTVDKNVHGHNVYEWRPPHKRAKLEQPVEVPARAVATTKLIDPMPPDNIPFNVAFYGRGEELVRMAELLDDSKIRSVIVSGIGGIGKTVLAQEAACRNRHLFSAVIYSSALNRPDYGQKELMEDADAVLDLKLGTIEDERKRAGHLLGAFNSRKCLLILDNVETVKGESRREIARLIGRINPLHGTKVVLSMRPALQEFVEMDGAASIKVDRLDVESCVRLFMEEAGKKSPPVARRILRAEEKQLRSLMEAAGRHPYMIKLAVGRAVDRSLLEVEEALRELKGELEERVEGWLKGSVDLLDDNARAVLRAFTVFIGSADREAVEAICGSDLDGDSGLERLIQASLMEYDPGLMRYELHQMVIDHIPSTSRWAERRGRDGRSGQRGITSMLQEHSIRPLLASAPPLPLLSSAWSWTTCALA